MKLKILVVDDQTIARTGTVFIVEAIGFKADIACNGSEALAQVMTHRYALILMDFNMPDMTGAVCTAKIRAIENTLGTRTPIIGFSASNETDARAKCLKAGMDDYLDKSCDVEELNMMVSKWAISIE